MDYFVHIEFNRYYTNKNYPLIIFYSGKLDYEVLFHKDFQNIEKEYRELVKGIEGIAEFPSKMIEVIRKKKISHSYPLRDFMKILRNDITVLKEIFKPYDKVDEPNLIGFRRFKHNFLKNIRRVTSTIKGFFDNFYRITNQGFYIRIKKENKDKMYYLGTRYEMESQAGSMGFAMYFSIDPSSLKEYNNQLELIKAGGFLLTVPIISEYFNLTREEEIYLEKNFGAVKLHKGIIYSTIKYVMKKRGYGDELKPTSEIVLLNKNQVDLMEKLKREGVDEFIENLIKIYNELSEEYPESLLWKEN